MIMIHSISKRVLVAALLLLSGCSLPKIVVLHDPLSAEEHMRLGTIYEAQDKPGPAREQYRMAAQQDNKHVKAWMRYGDLSYREGDLAEAEKAYEAAVDLDQTNGDVRNNLAWVYLKRDRKLSKARELVAQAMDLNPAHRPYYLDTLGMLLLRSGKVPEAIAALEASVATMPREQQAFLAEAHLHLAEAYAAAGDQERADAAQAHYLRLKQGSAARPAPEQ